MPPRASARGTPGPPRSLCPEEGAGHPGTSMWSDQPSLPCPLERRSSCFESSEHLELAMATVVVIGNGHLQHRLHQPCMLRESNSTSHSCLSRLDVIAIIHSSALVQWGILRRPLLQALVLDLISLLSMVAAPRHQALDPA